MIQFKENLACCNAGLKTLLPMLLLRALKYASICNSLVLVEKRPCQLELENPLIGRYVPRIMAISRT